MGIQWKQPEMKDRLLAAVIASSADLSMNEVARVFGLGATYDAVEGQLRKAKSLALILKEEAGDRDGPAATPSRKKNNNIDTATRVKTPVKGARVTKSKKVVNPKAKIKALAEDSKLFDAASEESSDDDIEDFV